MASKARTQAALDAVICLTGGVLLTLIGVRYLLIPEQAARHVRGAETACGV